MRKRVSGNKVEAAVDWLLNGAGSDLMASCLGIGVGVGVLGSDPGVGVATIGVRGILGERDLERVGDPGGGVP